MWCVQCGKQLPDNADFCSECGSKTKKTTQTVVNPVKATQSMPSYKKNIKLRIALIIAALAILIGLIAIIKGLLSKEGPAERLINSAIRTAFNGTEFSIAGYESYDQYSDDNLYLDGFISITTGDKYAEFFANVSFDGENIVFASTLDNNTLKACINDYYYGFDTESINLKQFGIKGDLIFELANYLSKNDLTTVDFEKLIEEVDVLEFVEDFIEPKDIDNALKAVIKALDRNAEECLGFEKDGDVYTYDIDVYDTLVIALEATEKYFVDEDDYEELMDFLKDIKQEIKEEIDSIEISVEFNGKYISEIETDFRSEYEDLTFSIEFSNTGECDEEIDGQYLDGSYGRYGY